MTIPIPSSMFTYDRKNKLLVGEASDLTDYAAGVNTPTVLIQFVETIQVESFELYGTRINDGEVICFTYKNDKTGIRLYIYND